MGNILIRNLDDAVLMALRKRAAEAGTSTEQEARQALAAAVGLSREQAISRLDAIRRKIGRLKGTSALEILREDRDRDTSAIKRPKRDRNR